MGSGGKLMEVVMGEFIVGVGLPLGLAIYNGRQKGFVYGAGVFFLAFIIFWVARAAFKTWIA